MVNPQTDKPLMSKSKIQRNCFEQWRSVENIVKNWREITFKNSRLLISAAQLLK
jgi:hypothetical protein